MPRMRRMRVQVVKPRPPQLRVNHNEHVEAVIYEPSRVVVFIDAATKELNVQVYKGTAEISDRRVPFVSHPKDLSENRYAAASALRRTS